MKKTLNKLKVILATLWGVIISIPSKVIGQVVSPSFDHMQTFYWVASPDLVLTQSPEPVSTITNIIRISQILVGAIVFVVWIINLIQLRKINDKALKQKKIKKTCIMLIIALLVIFLLSLSIRLIKKYAA